MEELNMPNSSFEVINAEAFLNHQSIGAMSEEGHYYNIGVYEEIRILYAILMQFIYFQY
jgi:hypothetical protein